MLRVLDPTDLVILSGKEDTLNAPANVHRYLADARRGIVLEYSKNHPIGQPTTQADRKRNHYSIREVPLRQGYRLVGIAVRTAYASYRRRLR